MVFEDVGEDRFGRIGTDFFPGFGVVSFCKAGVEELKVVIDLGEGPDGGAGGANRVFLLDGNCGRDAIDAVDLGFVHAVEELADVGGEGFDVAALALGIEGVEGEG